MRPSIRSLKVQPSGFTLLEVLVVVIIAGVLAAIAAPSWLVYLNNQRIGAVKSDLVQVLRQAQAEAIQERREFVVQFHTPTNPLASGGGRPIVDIGIDDDPATPPAFGVIERSESLGGDNIRPGMIELDVYTLDDTGTVVSDDDNQLLSFDHQGIPQQALPFIIGIEAPNINRTRRECVIVASVVGTIKTGRGVICDNPNVQVP